MPALRKSASSPSTFSFLSLCPHDPPFSLLGVLASTLNALLFLRPELQETGCTQPSWGTRDPHTCLLALTWADAPEAPGVQGLENHTFNKLPDVAMARVWKTLPEIVC